MSHNLEFIREKGIEWECKFESKNGNDSKNESWIVILGLILGILLPKIKSCSLFGRFFPIRNFHDQPLTMVIWKTAKECNFLKVNLTAINFFNFEFIETKFKKNPLDFLGVRSIKVWRSKQSIEIEKSSNLEKILKDMNFIISTDSDEIENS